MAKNKTIYSKHDGDIHPQTNTGQVLSPNGETLEHRLTRLTEAVQGKGESASAHEWPMRYLGSFGNVTQLNAALSEVFHTTDPHWQGMLKAHMSGQVVIIYQYALNFSIGDWMQMVVGMVAPSQDGTVLIRSNTPGIFWRSRETQSDTVIRNQWQSISTLSLKTVNGQSLLGTGNIEISASSGSITVDETVDPTSDNPVSGKAVAQALSSIAPSSSSDSGVVMVTYWDEQLPQTGMSEGEYALDYNDRYNVYRYNGTSWDDLGEADTQTLYVNIDNGGIYRYLKEYKLMTMLGGGFDKAISDKSTHKTSPSSLAVWNLFEGLSDYVNELGENPKYRVIRLWEQQAEPRDLVGWVVGDLYYDETSRTLYKVTAEQGGEFGDSEEVQWDNSTLYLRKQTGQLYYVAEDGNVKEQSSKVTPSQSISTSTTDIPSSNAVKTYVDTAVAAGGSEQGGTRGFGTDNYGDPLFPEYYLEVEFESEPAILGELYNSDDSVARQFARDYIANELKWGINFYDWPLRCYNGTGSYQSPLSTGAENVNVFAPSERLIVNFIRDTTSNEYNNACISTFNVKFNTVSNAFVLVYNGNVYSKWGNSKEWNDSVTGMARRDCVFSDISKADPTEADLPAYDMRKYEVSWKYFI